MPSLKTVMEDMLREGPVLTIRAEPVLAVQELLQESGEEVPSVTLTALVDTGASGTLVQSAVFSQIGIEPFSFAYLRTPSTNEPILCGRYRVRIVLSEALAFEVDAVNGALTGQNLQCLIGRDILQFVKLAYDGPRSRFTITQP